MDLRATLLEEHSKAQTLLVTNWIGENADRLAELMHLFLHDEYRVTQRAAWAISHVADKYPALFAPYLEQIVHNLKKEKIHVAVKRNTVRILQEIELPEVLWGDAAEICFGYAADMNEAIAVRAFSMGVCWNICQKVPELIPELEGIIELQEDYGSAGIKSRCRNLKKAIHKFKKANNLD